MGDKLNENLSLKLLYCDPENPERGRVQVLGICLVSSIRIGWSDVKRFCNCL